MADDLRKVKKGDKFDFTASAYNAFVDAAKYVKSRQADIGRNGSDTSDDSNALFIKNLSGSDRQRFDILCLDEPVFGPDDNENEFKSRLVMTAILPTQAQRDKMVVLLEPVGDGKIGRAALAGRVLVLVDFPDESTEFPCADIVDNDPSHLVASSTGPVQILWADSGIGQQWALVRWASSGTGGNSSARVATTSTATTHSGLAAIDSVTPVEGEIVLDWNNATPTLRGLWAVHTGAWTRAGTLSSGMLVTVREGTAKANTLWQLLTNGAIVPGVTSLTFQQLSPPVAFVTARLRMIDFVPLSGVGATVDGLIVFAGDRVFWDGNVYTVTAGAWPLYAASPDIVGVTSGFTGGPLIYLKSGSSYVALAGVYA